MSNIPTKPIDDLSKSTRVFFDTYGKKFLEFGANESEAAIGFFLDKGFQRDAAETTAFLLLEQAKLERRSIFKLLDTMRGLDDLQLSNIVATILNSKRKPISQLGYKFITDVPINIKRNIKA